MRNAQPLCKRLAQRPRARPVRGLARDLDSLGATMTTRTSRRFIMALKGHIFSAALLATASALAGCAYETSDGPVGSADEAVDGLGYNDLDPKAIENELLASG